ncbi:MAG: HNH endonuclease [Candidatus Omnitrophica bacterium]|nr:HNH endonuclease [Candidatus Omnitrophota bacterium]
MSRRKCTDKDGIIFTPERRDEVWGKADIVRGKDTNLYRKDVAGNILYKPSYGLDTPKGWEIDHINPVGNGGSDNLRNLQVLQTATNQSKGDTYPWNP